ncbi:fumarylacetoacetate hydrolase family protein [Streptomyces justiciae]|uniref:fumarylacetoacetate hydrolase family protein n=1 Tax=Streptomyces justiciae TaxID=2780140 RepID=UPI002118826D|nr:fumarylacetoacetate hydrolase family protein [Streptomyces justiciae]MCW8378672.1 fumarylacetoacetate hydrolase family protein [Streptomyces justiciae]
MKLANLDGRAVVVTPEGVIDLNTASGGRFSASPDAAVTRIAEIRQWLTAGRPQADPRTTLATLESDPSRLGPPVTDPRQIFAIGLNYADHSSETNTPVPDAPLVFSKWPSSLAGPAAEIPLPTETVDWELELVVVIGEGGRDIPAERAFDHIAGFCVGQDISERTKQLAGTPPQFGLAKSHRNFSPIGPWLTTLDELENPTDLALSATYDGDTVQKARTSDLIFDIPTLISYLSSVCELRPADVIFTGTPSGVGLARKPPRFMAPGGVLRSSIEGLGTLTNTCTAP